MPPPADPFAAERAQLEFARAWTNEAQAFLKQMEENFSRLIARAVTLSFGLQGEVHADHISYSVQLGFVTTYDIARGELDGGLFLSNSRLITSEAWPGFSEPSPVFSAGAGAIEPFYGKSTVLSASGYAASFSIQYNSDYVGFSFAPSPGRPEAALSLESETFGEATISRLPGAEIINDMSYYLWYSSGNMFDLRPPPW